MTCNEMTCNAMTCNAMSFTVCFNDMHCMSLHLAFTGNKPYTVFVQRIRVTLLAARFAIYLLDMFAK